MKKIYTYKVARREPKKNATKEDTEYLARREKFRREFRKFYTDFLERNGYTLTLQPWINLFFILNEVVLNIWDHTETGTGIVSFEFSPVTEILKFCVVDDETIPVGEISHGRSSKRENGINCGMGLFLSIARADFLEKNGYLEDFKTKTNAGFSCEGKIFARKTRPN